MSIARKIGNLGTALDSAALSTFLSKGTTDGEFDTIAWGDVTGKPSYIDSSLATQLFDSAYVQLRQSTVSSGGLDSAAVTSLIDSNYVAARATAASSSGFVMYNYNATAGQTAFQDSDTAGNVLSYTADGILVYYNGLLLADEDYTATDGAAVTLTEGADSGAQITIGKWNLTGSSSSSGGAAAWYGDRAVVGGGGAGTNQIKNIIDYYDMTTPGNASDFGDLTVAREMLQGAVSDATYGLFFGGTTYNDFPQVHTNVIDYITISTFGNATDFGDMTVSGSRGDACSDATYGVSTSITEYASANGLEYVTIASPGNASDFGDLTEVISRDPAAMNDATYGVFAGGTRTSSKSDTIDYITIASPGNASDFGDLTVGVYQTAGCSDDTYGLIMGGERSDGFFNTIDYVTIASPGNATDFGDLTAYTSSMAACSNGTYGNTNGNGFNGVFNTIEYVTIASPGNASDFGDLTVARKTAASTSGSPS